MFIYVSGPYSPATTETNQAEREAAIAKHISDANNAAIEIQKKGHIPFVPHTMMRGWQDINNIPRDQVLSICHKWLEKCDALYFIAASQGADSERQLAERLGLRIFLKLDEIPQESLNLSSASLSQQAMQGYLTEYQECMESYRHTYETIWQAGAIFTAISAAVVALTQSSQVGLAPWIQVLGGRLTYACN